MDLRSTQLKDTYGNLVTTGTTEGSPTEGGLQNGDGQLLTSVGIGTNSTSAKLTLNDAGQQVGIDFKENGTTRAHIEYDGSLPAFKVGSNGSAYLSLRTNNDEKLRIEADGDIAFYDDANNQGLFWDASAGSLGIGTGSTVDDKFHIIGTSTKIQELGQTGITMKFNHGNNASVNSDINIANIKSFVSSGSSGSEGGGLTFETKPTAGSATPRMTIDSSGNVLVGKTTSNIASVGVELFPNDRSAFTRNTGYPILVNRLTSDGDLINFQKDGTTVGSIGTIFSDLFIGTNDSGLRFEFAGTNAIVPFDVNSVVVSDNATDLGASSARFKDLYLGGSVYLGGTTSANALDDYEEGTFTPVVAGTWTANPTSLAGKYTKIGNVVHVQVTFSGGTKASATAGYLEDLPFAASHGTGVVVDSGVLAQGSVLFANTDRIWFTDNSFPVGTSRVTGTYLIN